MKKGSAIIVCEHYNRYLVVKSILTALQIISVIVGFYVCVVFKALGNEYYLPQFCMATLVVIFQLLKMAKWSTIAQKLDYEKRKTGLINVSFSDKKFKGISKGAVKFCFIGNKVKFNQNDETVKIRFYSKSDFIKFKKLFN